MIKGDDLRRFWSKTSARGECIEWAAGVDKDGYGKFATGPRGQQQHHRAHRWIYERTKGPLDGDLLRHRCDNPRCVRVDHLEPGTQLENVQDALVRGRRPSALTEATVRQLRAVRAAGGSIRAEAARLGVNYCTAYQAATGVTWKHIA